MHRTKRLSERSERHKILHLWPGDLAESDVCGRDVLIVLVKLAALLCL